jgi:hypothetical protein
LVKKNKWNLLCKETDMEYVLKNIREKIACQSSW